MIVGTAGHVDHGKSALVRALTGVDPDRLAEEKRRGISIELGFAYMPAGDGATIGFVDVPGHQDFIHHMLAGATGIDFVLLVVAADDGVMPQTVEHLAIVDLLGLARGAVALTKCDLVPPERRAEVRSDIVELLSPTRLAGADIVETSTMSGNGIETIRNLLVSAAENPVSAPKNTRFRMPVDRCFSLRGIGTVVTGTVLSGAVSVGDQVTIGPSGLVARVRSIHAQNQPAERGVAGQRCALNLAGDGVTKDAIARGDVALDPALHAPAQRIDARLRLLAEEKIEPWQAVRLHHGAAEIGAHVVPLGGDWVQIVLDRPIAAAVGDRYVLRDSAARCTIGGGAFADLRAPARRRRTPARLAQLEAMASDDVAALLDLPPYYLDFDAFRRDRALPAGDDPAVAVRLGKFALSEKMWSAFQQSLHAALDAFHAANPSATGAPPDALRRAVEPRLPAPLFAAALAELARRQIIAMAGGLARLPDRAPRLAPAQEAMWQKIQSLLDGTERFRPPLLPDIAAKIGAPETETRKTLKLATGLGLVEEVAPGRFFLRASVVEVAAIAGELAHEAANGEFGAAQLRDRLDNGRKLAIELLEYFDRRGITLRRGDLRRVDFRKLELFR